MSLDYEVFSTINKVGYSAPASPGYPSFPFNHLHIDNFLQHLSCEAMNFVMKLKINTDMVDTIEKETVDQA